MQKYNVVLIWLKELIPFGCDILVDITPIEMLKILQRLRISYDKLHEEDQWIFLDIVCYFIGEDRDLEIKICGMVELQNLEDKWRKEVFS